MVPIDGMEQVLGQPVHWIDARKPTSWSDIGLQVPRFFLQSGWSYPAFSALGREVKLAGGYVVGLSDANWRGDFRQLLLGPFAFRLRHRRHFDAFLVPGRQGERLLRYFGMPPNLIRTGMYGADPSLFSPGPPINERPREFLFVGQLIHRKDVLGLTSAFAEFSRQRPGWTLRICGSGELRKQIPEHPQIVVEDFVQPHELASRYRSARFLVLPSLVEAWGLVVHEASLCGCGLILSDAVGSGDDLASDRNSICFRAGNKPELVAALLSAADRNSEWLIEAGSESRTRARNFGPERFAAEMSSLVSAFGGYSTPASLQFHTTS
ncbi:glycosyltransferase family 4 protein [Mesorhizobium sp. M0633]|uniref:glycosyltransferase family 4 protein n=1 Tax=Mesorhizobium sp. M0633 TaxID=2956977 RepID=UPI003334F73F